MVGMYLALGGATTLGVGGLILIRSLVSRKWGYYSSNKKLNGQVIILTGGNVGLGAEVAKDLAARGATLVLACRSWERTRLMLDDLRKASNNNDVHFIKLDLADLQSINEFVKEFAAKYTRLDSLICNAGVWVPMEQGRKTQQGFEIHAGVNHLGHYYLTKSLLELLKSTANSRVVVVSSGLSKQGKFDMEAYDHFGTGRTLEPGAKGFAPTGYCDSKLMNALFTKTLAVESGVSSMCVCPGWCYTQLARYVNIPFYKKILFLPVCFLFMRSAARGAHNILHAALEDNNNLTSGGFYRECKLSSEDMTRLHEMSDSAAQLWRVSDQLLQSAEKDEKK